MTSLFGIGLVLIATGLVVGAIHGLHLIARRYGL